MATSDGPVPLRTFTLPPFPKPTPLENTYAEIRSLCMRTDLMGNVMLGSGELPPEEIVENKRRRLERARLRLEIIAKHEVEEHFLADLRKDAAKYRADLERAENQIAALEASIAARTTRAKA